MRLLGLALTALLLAGCAIVPLAPVAYGPEPAVRVIVPLGGHYGRPAYTRGGYHRHYHR
jgi:hypothetical protein